MTARRISAGLLAIAAIGTLVVRIYLNMDKHDTSLFEALWAIYRFFTIWTISLIGLASLIIAVTGRLDGRISGGLLLAVSAVGIVYHLLLAHLYNFVGIDVVLDEMLHTVIPIWFALHWVAFEPKASLNLRDLMLWLSYPMVYCVFALTRAAFDGEYPYHFLDIADHGVAIVARNIVGLVVVFALLGAAIILVAQFASRRAQPA